RTTIVSRGGGPPRKYVCKTIVPKMATKISQSIANPVARTVADNSRRGSRNTSLFMPAPLVAARRHAICGGAVGARKQRRPAAPRVFDERVFEIQIQNVPRK